MPFWQTKFCKDTTGSIIDEHNNTVASMNF